jgi:hypothetical protein
MKCEDDVGEGTRLSDVRMTCGGDSLFPKYLLVVCLYAVSY